MKICFKCNRMLPISEFYRHPRMKDGTLNKCKQCTKLDVRKNYGEKLDKYHEYETRRNSTEHRRGKMLDYQRNRRWRNPQKDAAYRHVRNAVKSGRLTKEACRFCGETKVQAHHHDYSKPLDVIWVCFKCHREKFHNQEVTSKYLSRTTENSP